MQMAIQTKEGLGIEYDEDVVCDVCRMVRKVDAEQLACFIAFLPNN